MQEHPLKEPLLNTKLVAILRGVKFERAIETVDILAAAGVSFMEIPLNTPRAIEIIALLAKHFLGTPIHIGAGTVLRPEQVDAVCDAGGEYILSPNVNTAVIRRTIEHGLLSMPGFQTPTEAFTAIDAGAHLLKAFPCGTPQNVFVLKSVIPLPIFAVGGIDRTNRDAFLKTADGVGVGIGIFSPDMSADELRATAAAFMEGWR